MLIFLKNHYKLLFFIFLFILFPFFPFLSILFFIVFLLFSHFFVWSPPEGATFLWLGVPGSGKTTLCAWIADYYLKRDVKVFSNVPISGCLKYDWKVDFGHSDMSDSVVLCDEAGIYLNGRNWKYNFDNASLEVVKKFRHYKMTLHFFSQSCDEDPVVRNLAFRTYVVTKSIIPNFIKVRCVKKSIDIDENSHQLVDSHVWQKFSTRLVWGRKVWHLFDTHDCVPLPAKEFETWE